MRNLYSDLKYDRAEPIIDKHLHGGADWAAITEIHTPAIQIKLYPVSQDHDHGDNKIIYSDLVDQGSRERLISSKL